MQVLFIKSNPHYQGMAIVCHEAGITLQKNDKDIVTEWAKPDHSVPSEDELNALMNRWKHRWMKRYNPTTWKSL